MPYILINDFKAGLDSRRLAVAAVPGSLIELDNAHINRGGEIEKRKAFVSKHALPAGTFGMAATATELIVFGSAVDPGVPSGVIYQRLQHPDGLAMTDIVHTEIFDGKVRAIAEFSDGSRYPYYDEALDTDWVDGVVRSTDTDADGIAAALATLVDLDDNVSATSSGAVVTITGEVGEEYNVTSSAVNGEGNANDDQTATVVKTQTAIATDPEVLARGELQITGGEPPTSATGSFELTAGASGSVDTVTVNSVEIMGGAENFDTDLDTTAANVAAAITANTSTPNYTATAAGAVVTIIGAPVNGADDNALVVAGTTTTTTLANEVNMSGGITRRLETLTVDGISIIGAWVPYTTSNSGTASAIVDSINGATTSPNYTAELNGDVVCIIAAAGSGDGPNGFIINATFVNSDDAGDPVETGVDIPPPETPVTPDPEPTPPEDPFNGGSDPAEGD